MPYITVPIATVTFSSGATASPSIHLTDDAEALGMICASSTSALTVEVAHSTSTGATFVPLWAGLIGSTPVLMASSGGARTIIANPYLQIRLTSTAIVNAGTSVTICKQIPV